MLAALLLAATLPLGVWPVEAGAAATVVDGVEFFVVEPDEDYFILAVQPLAPPLERPEPAALGRLATLAARLGADAVLLLGELGEAEVPDDLDEPLRPGRRLAAAVYVTFAAAAPDEPEATLTRAALRGARAVHH